MTNSNKKKVNIDRYFAAFDAAATPFPEISQKLVQALKTRQYSNEPPLLELPRAIDARVLENESAMSCETSETEVADQSISKKADHGTHVEVSQQPDANLINLEIQQKSQALDELKRQLQAQNDNCHRFYAEPDSVVPESPLSGNSNLLPDSKMQRNVALLQTALLSAVVSLGVQYLSQHTNTCDQYHRCRQTLQIMQRGQQHVQVQWQNLQDHFNQTRHIYSQALLRAKGAAEAAQVAKTPDQWKQVGRQWGDAISLLDTIPESSQWYAAAQEKIQAYRANQAYAEIEEDSFREGVNAAIAAANLTQTANSLTDWRQVSSLWIEAIELMKYVSPQSEHYKIAQQKITEYAENLAYSQRLYAIHMSR